MLVIIIIITTNDAITQTENKTINFNATSMNARLAPVKRIILVTRAKLWGFSTDAVAMMTGAYEGCLENIRRNREEIEKLGIQDVKASLVTSSNAKRKRLVSAAAKVVKAKREKIHDVIKQLE